MSNSLFIFSGSNENELVGRVEIPVGEVRTWAVFAHCFTCGGESLAAVRISRALASQGIGVLRYDFAGLGRSGGAAFQGVTTDVEDLTAAVHAMRAAGMFVSLLIGHSLGGIAAVETAASVPGICAVATIGAPSSAGHLATDVTPGEQIQVQVGGIGVNVTPGFVEDLDRHALASTLKASSVPILVLHAPRDRIVGIDHASRIYAAARHQKSFVCLPGADHLLTRRDDCAYAASVIGAWAEPYLHLQSLG